METFQITLLPKKNARRLREDDRRMRGKGSAQMVMIEALLRELRRGGKKKKTRETRERRKKKDWKGSPTKNRRIRKKGPDKADEKSQVGYPSVAGMLEELEQILHHIKGADAHPVRNSSKWK
ncbi:hypothetical protein PIB30_009656 [Stylosanthes scabra]|uniref:Uncharacterized protein n=1 Tax=Stylosanthes scabra TaxID=79078 RepID=A0ABU6T6Q1_9FABA|nr:hypothetical protein [Stylosanthes scabra]